ncbi:MAG: carboxypeptidase regulatory-like domain-containing protein [Rikenellaceae bacterium]
MKKFVLSFLSLVMTTMLFAQVTTSSVGGVVNDQTGEPLVGATVLAIHEPSGTQYGAVVDSKGYYRLQNLRPGGPYSISVSMLGYVGVEVTDLELALADNLIQNYVLKDEAKGIDAVAVIVEGENSNMKSSQAGAITNVKARDMALMPTTSRSLTDMVRGTPQANGTSIGGGTYRQNNISVDGAAFNNSFGIGSSMPGNGSPISIDALEQISVSITPYDVRQSNFIGSSINAVTRSGDNEFRASVYTYMNNDSFYGNKVGDVEFDISDAKYNMYGFRVGGPIVKDKLFFFVNYETGKTIEPGPTKVASTSDKPYSDGSDNVARPSEDMMNTISDYLMSEYGYETGPYQGYSYESPEQKILARIDWNINKNHKLNVRFSHTSAESFGSGPSSSKGPATYTGYRTDMTSMAFRYAQYSSITDYLSISGELNSTFADKYYNTLRVSYSHQDEPRGSESEDFPFVDIVEDGYNYASFGTELYTYGNLREVETFTITDDVSWTSGINNFTAGFSFEYDITTNGFQRYGTGYYQYDSWEDFVNGEKATAFGITYPNTSDFSQAYPSFEYQQFSVYFQDEIDVSPYLKMTAGLRLDLPFFPDITEAYHPLVAETNIAGTYYDTSKLPKESVLFSPRVGFNWDIKKDRSLVLRGGTGLFTGRIPFVWIVAQAGDSGILQTTISTTDQSEIPDFYPTTTEILNSMYPDGAPEAGTELPSYISMMSEDFKMPQVWKTSLALDAQLPWDIKGSAEFIVNKDINAANFYNYGITYGSKWGGDDNAEADRIVYTYGSYYNSTLKNVYVIENGPSGGYYWSATAKFEKSFNFGLNAMVSYTRSDARNYTDAASDQVSSSWQNKVSVNGANADELGYAGYVVPNNLVASVSYRTKPYAKGFMSTEVGVFYQGGEQGRYSYTHDGSVASDGAYNTLLYVPNDASEITFADYTPSGWDEVYTAEQQSEDFFNFIDNDKYLSSRKGQYTERNAGVYPWVSQFDIKFVQNFHFKTNGKPHTIQVGLDILNVGNLLNSKWGNQYAEYGYDTDCILDQVGYTSANGGGAVYNFLADGTKVRTNEIDKYIGTSSTYSMQLSFRYIFN